MLGTMAKQNDKIKMDQKSRFQLTVWFTFMTVMLSANIYNDSWTEKFAMELLDFSMFEFDTDIKCIDI